MVISDERVNESRQLTAEGLRHADLNSERAEILDGRALPSSSFS